MTARLGVRASCVGIVLALGAVSSACGDTSDPPADAGPDAPPDAALASSVAPPNITWWNPTTGGVVPPAQTTACTFGRRLEEDGLTFCEPWPEGGQVDCGPGEAHFPGGPGCEPVGEPCPSGRFSTMLPTDHPVRYVDPTASPGGDGSLASPFQTIAAAISLAPTETVIALSKGTFDEAVRLENGIVLHGACAAETIISPTGLTGPVAAVTLVGASGLRNLTVRSSRNGVIAGEVLAFLEGVVIEDVQDSGILSVAELQAARLVVRRTRRAEDPAATAVAVLGGAVRLRQLVLDDNEDLGFFTGMVNGYVEGLTVTDTHGATSGSPGIAIGAGEGTDLDITMVVVERAEEWAIQVEAGARVTLAEMVVRDTRPSSFGDRLGMGLRAAGDCQVDLRRARFDHLRFAAISSAGGSPPPTFVIQDLIVRDIEPELASGNGGTALTLYGGAQASVSRAALLRTSTMAVFVEGERTHLDMDNTFIGEAFGREDGHFGRGINVQLLASATIDTTVIERAEEIGIAVLGATAIVRDTVIRDTLGQESDGISGRGLSVEAASVVTGERIRIERAREVSLIAIDPGSSIVANDVSVIAATPQACAITTCPETPFGVALGSYYGARVELAQFELVDAELCGLQVAEGGSLDVRQGTVRGAEIGGCVQIDGYDLGRLSNAVTYVDNGSNLESTTLPVPQPMTMP